MNATSDLVVAGIFAMMPFRLAVARQRLILGLAAFVVCLLSGLLGGPFLAIPVAGVCAVVIVVVGPRTRASATDLGQEYDHLFLQAVAPAVQPPANPTTPALTPEKAQTFVRLAGGELPLQCGQCGNAFGASAANLPPWCPRCGADVKKRQPETATPS